MPTMPSFPIVPTSTVIPLGVFSTIDAMPESGKYTCRIAPFDLNSTCFASREMRSQRSSMRWRSALGSNASTRLSPRRWTELLAPATVDP